MSDFDSNIIKNPEIFEENSLLSLIKSTGAPKDFNVR